MNVAGTICCTICRAHSTYAYELWAVKHCLMCEVWEEALSVETKVQCDCAILQ